MSELFLGALQIGTEFKFNDGRRDCKDQFRVIKPPYGKSGVWYQSLISDRSYLAACNNRKVIVLSEPGWLADVLSKLKEGL